ncbi:hypothetical protein C8A03DRAFT_40933 [Achaetomium macrosporum]|uniref:Uncharacterized protein n=1 Tax=Achaetomium macrosporum TaxID=79813 RepID=A0AAN7HE42_9PEZI|nr:hypothetical protein C8A03DRAFT_40933 [Achaetomium macrosporum]
MSCGFVGNSDMYGFGIRIGFYLQWYGGIAANWLAQSEVKGLRLADSLFISATFLALIIQTPMATLQPVEIYIILLLTYGSFYFLVPLYFWRLATACNPLRDPTRWTRVKPGRVYSVACFGLLMAETSFQLWFWCTGINTIPREALDADCPEYGFLFARVALNNPLFIAGNIMLNLLLLIFSLVFFCLGANLVPLPRALRKKERRARRHPPSDGEVLGLQLLQSALNCTVASIIVAATELTIQWNNISGVNDVSTAGQIIPVIIAAGLVSRVVYVYLFEEEVDAGSGGNGSGSGSSQTGSSTTPGPQSPRPRAPDPIYTMPPRQSMPPPPPPPQ